MEEELQLRLYGEATRPALIYLPGLHGDWTLIGGFRKALADRTRFVEMTYPRTLTWSVDDYAAAIETALAEHGLAGGWLLGESFGSQPLWAMAARARFQAQGLILAGGFVGHPMRHTVRLAERLIGQVPAALLIHLMFGYAQIARFRYRRSPATRATLEEFVARRTGADRLAAQHRLHLVAQFDPRPIAARTCVPVFGLTGFLDPIVPWPLVRRWLRKNCPALREYRVIAGADHNVLTTAPAKAAEQVWKWMNEWGPDQDVPYAV